MIRMRFEGGTELAAAFAGLPTRWSRRTKREALLEGGEPIRRRGAQLAPHEPGAPDLREHIVMSTARPKEDADAVSIAIGPSKEFFYGFFQEVGTRHHGAQPFMRPAFDSERAQTLGIIGKALWRELAGRGISRSTTVLVPVQSGGRFL